MNDDARDHELRARFEAQRTAESARAPSFARVRQDPPQSSRRTLMLALSSGALVAATAVAALIVFRPAPTPIPTATLTVAGVVDDTWSTPSDALLAADDSAAERRLMSDIDRLLQH